MLNHSAVALALRNHLLSLQVLTTGSISLSATTTTYERATGSFFDDGFAVGMEVTPSGFTDSDSDVITALTATLITTKGEHAADVAASGRSLSVLLPSRRAWENVHFEPTTDMPYVEEEYIPGPTEAITVGETGELEALPLYVVRVYVPQNVGRLAPLGYIDALLTHFAPKTAITVASGSSLRVRTRPAPFPGQLRALENGFAFMPINVPLLYRTPNII